MVYCLWSLFFLFAACHAGVTTDPATLRISMGAEPDTLNPILASDAYASQILDYVNDYLIERDPDTLEFEPRLATGWEISPDHLRYTFHLRKDVFWHDGTPFTADDVVYSFDKIKDPTVEAPFLRVYYADIVKAEKLDPTTVRFVYSKPYFLGLSVCGGIPIIPKQIFEDGTDFNHHPASRRPIGTGPFTFVEWRTNKKIVLARNEKYWGDKPGLARIEFKIVTDSTIALQILKKGELDMASLRPIQWVRQTGTEKFTTLFNRFQYLVPGYNYIGWNNKNPLFVDRRVRLAMTHLIDREKLLAKINFGLGRIVESPFFPGAAQYAKDLPSIPHDVAAARRLLAEAGWRDSDHDGILDREGRIFSFTFLYPASSKFAERVAPILKEDFKNNGIDMRIERLEWAAFLARIEKKEFDVVTLGWSTSFESDPYQIWHSSQAQIERGSNFIAFENQEVDRLIEAARVEFNDERRNALYAKFQKILHEEQPYTFLFASDSLVAVARRFGNVVVHKAGLDPREWTVTP